MHHRLVVEAAGEDQHLAEEIEQGRVQAGVEGQKCLAQEAEAEAEGAHHQPAVEAAAEEGQHLAGVIEQGPERAEEVEAGQS